MRGMYAMDKIKVLWMNNGDESLLEYIELGKNYQIDITPCKCMTDCRHLLNDLCAKWDAVILNAKINDLPKEKPSVYKLNQAYNDVSKYVPCFVVIPNEHINKASLLNSIPKGERYYNLEEEHKDLFDAIFIKVSNNPMNRVLEKYADVCRFCNHVNLPKLLIELESDEQKLQTDNSVPNLCRDLLEWLEKSPIFNRYHMNYKAISSKLEEKRRDELAKYKETSIPPHLTRSFHFCCEVTNDGSHNLITKGLIASGKVPYLNKSLILNLLNVFYWCASLDEKTFEL